VSLIKSPGITGPTPIPTCISLAAAAVAVLCTPRSCLRVPTITRRHHRRRLTSATTSRCTPRQPRHLLLQTSSGRRLMLSSVSSAVPYNYTGSVDSVQMLNGNRYLPTTILVPVPGNGICKVQVPVPELIDCCLSRAFADIGFVSRRGLQQQKKKQT
jgi:hypothetical protein